MTDKLPPWSLGVGFVLLIAMFPAIVIIALVTDLSDSQLDIFNTAIGVIAVVVGAGFGVAVQASKVRAAERGREQAEAERDEAIQAERDERNAAVRAEEAKRAAAVEAAARHERDLAEARLAEAKARVLETAARWQHTPNLQVIRADNGVRPKTLVQQARESPDAFYVMDSPADLPTGLDSAALMEEIAEAFEEPAS